jgi:phosphate-selective porin OprO/OprP
MPKARRYSPFASLLVALLSRGAAAQGAPPLPPSPAEAPPSPAVPPPSASPPPADSRVDDLDQRLKAVERRWEAEQEALAEKKAEERKNVPGVAVAYGKEGVSINSADGKFQFRFRPVVQADARFFVKSGSDTFLLRRVRPVIEGTAFEFFDWRILPELAGTPTVMDAYVNVRVVREVQLRAGKFKPPVGLERLQQDADLVMTERGLPTNLVPDRDVGLQLHGELLDGAITYAGGVFNGVDDGVNADVDNNDKKDLDGRVWVRPFAPLSIAPLAKLGLGVAATRGTHVGPLAGYKTTGQQTFFSYAANAWAVGTHRRISPQASYYFGPFGISAEYVRSSQIVATSAVAPHLVNHDAWQVQGSIFVTGEDASYTTVTPKNQLDPAHGHFGAFELTGRVGELRIDDAAFTLGFADRNAAAAKAKEWAVGLNWHLARNFKLMGDYVKTTFDGGAKGTDRPTEIVVLTRLQAAY